MAVVWTEVPVFSSHTPWLSWTLPGACSVPCGDSLPQPRTRHRFARSQLECVIMKSCANCIGRPDGKSFAIGPQRSSLIASFFISIAQRLVRGVAASGHRNKNRHSVSIPVPVLRLQWLSLPKFQKFRIQKLLKMETGFVLFWFLNWFGSKRWLGLFWSYLVYRSHWLWILIYWMTRCSPKHFLGCCIGYNTFSLKPQILNSKTNLTQEYHVREVRAVLLLLLLWSPKSLPCGSSSC